MTFKRDQGLDGEQEPAPSPPPVGFGAVDTEPAEEEESAVVEDDEPEPPGAGASEPEPEVRGAGGRARGRLIAGGGAPAPEASRQAWRAEASGRAASAGSFEATFDHGEEGYGLWLDPAVAENDVYAEHWAGHRAVSVKVEPDAITIRRAGEDGEEGDDGD